MNNNKLYKLLMILIAVVWIGQANAQVTIGSATVDPHPGAVLDLNSGNSTQTRGVLLAYVTLTSATAWAPLGGSATDGMMVFNVSTSTTNGLAGKGIYVWMNSQWALVSSNGGMAIGTSCPGVVFNISLQNAPISACPNAVLPTTIKVVATGGNNNTFTYSGDFNADGTLKSAITMPSSGAKLLYVKVTDTSNNCYGEYNFVIPTQTAGCP